MRMIDPQLALEMTQLLSHRNMRKIVDGVIGEAYRHQSYDDDDGFLLTGDDAVSTLLGTRAKQCPLYGNAIASVALLRMLTVFLMPWLL